MKKFHVYDFVEDNGISIYVGCYLIGAYVRISRDRRFFLTLESQLGLYIIDDYGNLVYSGRNL